MEELYKKYRPRTFEEMVGNTSAIKSMQKELENGSHVFLLTGASGTGKTTLARIVAGMVGATDMSIHELNSSNNRGIDSARDIMEEMQYTPITGESTVYILDECHQITATAQNSFLKALEDTPAHVYFFLCTTDPQKLIAPLKTRCSIINLSPLTDKEMQFLIKRTARAEKLTVSADVVKLIVSIAEGSSRKALKELQKVLYLDDEEEKLDLLKADMTGEENESIELCRVLMKKDTKWADIASVLRTLNIQDAERVRQSVMGYMNSVLLKGTRIPEAESALQAFGEQSTYQNGKFSITIACLDYLSLLS